MMFANITNYYSPPLPKGDSNGAIPTGKYGMWIGEVHDCYGYGRLLLRQKNSGFDGTNAWITWIAWV